MKNCYETLGTSKYTNFEQIQEGYREQLDQLNKYYDKYTNFEQIQEGYQEQLDKFNEHYDKEKEEIIEARKILSDGNTRQAYNLGLEQGHYKGIEDTYRQVEEEKLYGK